MSHISRQDPVYSQSQQLKNIWSRTDLRENDEGYWRKFSPARIK